MSSANPKVSEIMKTRLRQSTARQKEVLGRCMGLCHIRLTAATARATITALQEYSVAAYISCKEVNTMQGILNGRVALITGGVTSPQLLYHFQSYSC